MHDRLGEFGFGEAVLLREAQVVRQGDDIVPIPGTKRVSRVEENTAADGIVLTTEQIATLDQLTPAEGGHHTDAQMQMIER